MNVVRCQVDFHTRVRSHKDTQIIEIIEQKAVYGTMMAIGRLKVTEQVTGYDRIHTRSGKILDRQVLDLPPMTFETQGLWFVVPPKVIRRAETQQIHTMGGLHALEHAAIGVLPLLVLTDRADLGGISTPFHPQLGSAGVFIYDGLPGGAGLCHQAFADGPSLFDATHSAITGCPCEVGCPSCVHSPKCGSGNRPIDKHGAIFLLEQLMAPADDANAYTLSESNIEIVAPAADPLAAKAANDATLRFGVLDIETQKSAQEVGGWHRCDRMGISCVVLYDSSTDEFYEFVEGQIPMLMRHLDHFDLVIGFNIRRFDYRVLSAYSDIDFSRLPTLDILDAVKDQLGYRLSLDHLAEVTLGSGKTADGLDALKWWQEGKMARIIEYCRDDVALTRDLYRYGRENGFLLFRNKAKQTVRLPVSW